MKYHVKFKDVDIYIKKIGRGNIRVQLYACVFYLIQTSDKFSQTKTWLKRKDHRQNQMKLNLRRKRT